MSVTLIGRKKIHRDRHQAPARLPQVLGVKSGASWDEVRVRLMAGQKPEDIDEVARALASARGVQRCQVRELTPNVVSIDFQRRNLLAEPVACHGGVVERMAREGLTAARSAWSSARSVAQSSSCMYSVRTVMACIRAVTVMITVPA